MRQRKVDFKPADGELELERVETAAAYLKISRAGLFDLIRRGEIDVVRIGRRVRVAKKTLAEFVAKRLPSS